MTIVVVRHSRDGTRAAVVIDDGTQPGVGPTESAPHAPSVVCFCPGCLSPAAGGLEACPRCKLTRPEAGWPRDANIGRVIKHKYRLEQRLGAGGFGLVFRATQVQGELEIGDVVLKFLHREMAAHEQVRKRFVNEARAARQIHSPHAVKVFDLDFDEDGTPFMVMESESGYSSTCSVVVTAPPACGFDSQFTTDAAGWSPVYGSWSVASGSYATTNGPAQAYHSAAYGQTYSNFTIEAKMRSSGLEPLKHHGIWFRGVASSTGYANNWPSGYLFSINYSGQFAVQIMVGSGYVVPWQNNAAVTNNNWNALKVVAQGSSLTFFINGTQVASVTDTLYATGSVGLMIAGNNYGGISNLEVDYATLTCLP